MQGLADHDKELGFYFRWKAEEPLTGLEGRIDVVR